MHTLKHFYILYLYSKLKCIINDISNRLTKRVSNMLRQQKIKIHLYAHCTDLFLLKLNQKLNFDTPPQPCLFAPMYVHTYVQTNVCICTSICLKTCFCCVRCSGTAGSRGASATRMSGQLCSFALLTSHEM